MGEMKQCPQCGAQLRKAAKYCGDCGYRFPNIMDIQPEAAKPNTPPAPSAAEKPSRKKKREKKAPVSNDRPRIGLVIVLTLISLVIIGGFVWFLDSIYQKLVAEEEAERGRREAEEEEEPEEEDEKPSHHEIAPLLGTSLKTENGEYYFPREGDLYFFISEDTENYIKGSITVKDLTKEDVESSEAAGIETAVKDADYYRVDAVVAQELYYGSKRSGNTYTMYVATNGENAAIYDSGWGNYYLAEVGELEQRGRLEAHFQKEPGQTVAVVTDTGAVTGTDYSVENIRFGEPEGVDDRDYLVAVGSGSDRYYIFKSGDYFQPVLYISETPGDVNHSEEFVTAPDGSFIGTFAADEDYLYYTLGRQTESGYVLESLCRIGLDGGAATELLRDEVEDFFLSDDALYYTDYAKIVRLDLNSLKAEEIWSYGVYCFELYEDMIFVYDGEAWEMIDAITGAEYGYVIDKINYSYECDVAQIENNMIFHVAHDYTDGTVALHAIDIENGREYTIGDVMDGTGSDSYNVCYSGKYAYFTVDDWETIARVDVTNGETRTIRLSDAGYYYVNDIMLIDGKIVLHAYDSFRNECLLQLDEYMKLTEYH